jgi:hypothetical protein
MENKIPKDKSCSSQVSYNNKMEEESDNYSSDLDIFKNEDMNFWKYDDKLKIHLQYEICEQNLLKSDISNNINTFLKSKNSKCKHPLFKECFITDSYQDKISKKFVQLGSEIRTDDDFSKFVKNQCKDLGKERQQTLLSLLTVKHPIKASEESFNQTVCHSEQLAGCSSDCA